MAPMLAQITSSTLRTAWGMTGLTLVMLLATGCGQRAEAPPVEPESSLSMTLPDKADSCAHGCTHIHAIGEPAAAAEPELPVEQPVLESVVEAAPITVVAPQVPELSERNRALAAAIANGQPITVSVGDDQREYLFRPENIVGDDFKISLGTSTQMAAEFRVYNGRHLLGDSQLGRGASLALVNDALALAYEGEDANYLIEQLPDGRLQSRQLRGAHVACDCAPGDRVAGTHDHAHQELSPPRFVTIAASGEPPVEAVEVDHSFFRLGPQYDASLVDLPVIWVSAKSETGATADLSSRAATYFVNFARHHDVYEWQLGFRSYLMELILIPNDSSEEDPGYTGSYDGSNGTMEDLDRLYAWVADHRPQNQYKWGHVAGWTKVEGSYGGTIGWAYRGGYAEGWQAYGNSLWGLSVSERGYDWRVIDHEMGHNVGAAHTTGGAMDPTIRSGQSQSFFMTSKEGSFSGAMDIYEYMSQMPVALNKQYGPATLRNPSEIPFAIDDAVSTAANTPVTISPLANDLNKVLSGSTNSTLTLVETGMLYPPSAGRLAINGNTIVFTPSSDFTGQAWFSYTMRGNVGNGGQGWMHAADVIVTVGGSSAAPTQSPSLQLVDDYVASDLLSPVRVNPLLNDVAAGRFGMGDIDALSTINGSAQSYSQQSFFLTGATIVTGNGSLALETRDVINNASLSSAYNGYLEYTPAGSEVAQVVIEYSAEDANGATGTARIYIGPSVPRVIKMDVVTDFTWQMTPGPETPTPTVVTGQEVFEPVPASQDQVLDLAPAAPL